MSKTRILIFLFFLILKCNNQIPENFDFSSLPGITITSESDITTLLNSTDITYFLFYYKKESSHSKGIGQLLKNIYPKIKYLAEFLLIDCDNGSLSSMTQCQNQNNMNDDVFVYFEIYEPPIYKINPYTKKINTHVKRLYDRQEVEEKSLFNFIAKSIVSRAQELNEENYDIFINNPKLNKFILFTEKTRIPLLFRGISNYFYDQISFGIVNKKEKKLCEKLGINKFPSLMMYKNIEDEVLMDEPKILFYEGKQTAEDIINYLKDYAKKEKFYKSNDNVVNENQNDAYFYKLNPEKVLKFIEDRNNKELILYFDNNLDKDVFKKNDYSKINPDVVKFNEETHGFFLFGLVNCTNEENEKFCLDNFKIKKYPSLILLKSKKKEENTLYENKEERIKNLIELSLEYNEIEKEINSEYEGKLKESNQNTISSVLSEVTLKKKLAALYIFDTSVQLSINLLSLDENLNKIFDFIVLFNPSEELKSNLKITNLPHFTIAFPTQDNKGGLQMLPYMGQITYSKLKNFIEQTFRFEKGNNNEENTNIEVKIDFLNNTNDLITSCSKKKLCMIAFFDMRNNNEDIIKKFNETYKIYEEVSKKSSKRPISFAYINATCQSEFSSKFNIDVGSLPNLVIYSYNKDVYSNLIGTFTVEDISEFITKTVSGRVNFQKIQKENAFLQDINCELIHEEKMEDDDDDIMKEIIEEEKKKREAFDKERGVDDQKKKKKKKKKKKNKKESDL